MASNEEIDTQRSLNLVPLSRTITNINFSSDTHIHYYYLTIRLRARVFYEQIVNEAQPS